MMLILTYAYSGNLTSGLVTPTYQPIANTLEDLINLNMKITTLSNTPLLQSFLVLIGYRPYTVAYIIAYLLCVYNR